MNRIEEVTQYIRYKINGKDVFIASNQIVFNGATEEEQEIFRNHYFEIVKQRKKGWLKLRKN